MLYCFRRYKQRTSFCLLKDLKSIFHMEAGNRCFDQNVPEEFRKVADHLADINITFQKGRRYLLSGFRKDFVLLGSLKEVLNHFSEKIINSKILNELGVIKQNYIVASIHREENLDLNDNFEQIIKSFDQVSKKYKKPILFSTHPRTKSKIKSLGIKTNSIKFLKPLGFFDYVYLQSNAFVTLSDSGTVSEESSMINFPAVSIRTSTERPESIDTGVIIIGGIKADSILQSTEIAVKSFTKDKYELPKEYTIKNVSDRVVKIIQGYTSIINSEVWKK